ncbi:hypothetical protein FIBSPDRAFT_854751, partial [Athelia psychrophila]
MIQCTHLFLLDRPLTASKTASKTTKTLQNEIAALNLRKGHKSDGEGHPKIIL